jgi:peptidoglycan/xylan/chitin deacetylase (PgdA/CDA1 family)
MTPMKMGEKRQPDGLSFPYIQSILRSGRPYMSATFRAISLGHKLIGATWGRQRLTVLTYHSVPAEFDPLGPSDQITAPVFAQQMQLIADEFKVLPLAEAVSLMREGRLPARALSITFDDGYVNNHDVALPILGSLGLTATFFVCTAYLDGGLMFNDMVVEAIRASNKAELDARTLDSSLGILPLHDVQARAASAAQLISYTKYQKGEARSQTCARLWEMLTGHNVDQAPRLMMNSQELQHLHRQGMTLGGHTHNHPILSQCTPEETRIEIETNRARLRDITGLTPTTFAYPNGRPNDDFDQRHSDIVKHMGFDCAFTTARGVCTCESDPYQLPRFAPWPTTMERLMINLVRNEISGHTLTPA